MVNFSLAAQTKDGVEEIYILYIDGEYNSYSF
jgi:hypothetical protein